MQHRALRKARRLWPKSSRMRSGLSRRTKIWSAMTMVGVMLVWILPFAGQNVAASQVVFSVEDRLGDDYGSGAVTYPLHHVFEPGLFDLRRVHIWHDNENIYFDISFAKVTNPWKAPEGFFHQLIDVYIDSEPGGHLKPVAPGPGIMFSPEAGWEYRLRIQPWGGSRWLDARSDPAKVHPIKALLLPDNKTIRGEVPLEIAGIPTRKWQYYVLVGGFDTFGPDQYRAIQEVASQWSFGGATMADGPNVIDLLDPRLGGKRSQKAQLETKDLAQGEYPVLIPVSHGLSLPFTMGHLLASLAMLCLLGGIFITVFRQEPPGYGQ